MSNGERGADGFVKPSSADLDRLARTADSGPAARGRPPVHLWNPPYCGDLDIRIKRDGSWWYLGSRITREPLVRLFGSILRKEDGKHFLVTPVEKVGIIVEDAPFIGVDVDALGEDGARRIEIETNHGDRATLGPNHPLRIEYDPATGEPAPYIAVRDQLEARLDRKSFFRLADLASPEDGSDGARLGVWSCGAFHPLEPAARGA